MTTGTTVLQSIKTSRKRIQTEERELQDRLKELEESVRDKQTEREETYEELARLYLPDLSRESVRNTIQELRTRASEQFERKRERREAVEASLSELATERVELEEKLETVTSELNDVTAAYNEKLGVLEAELHAKEGYTELREEYEARAERQSRLQAAHRQATAERDAKLPAYEANKQFAYLLGRNYGAEGTTDGLVGKLDGWIADRLDYKEQKANYDRLRKTPELLAEEIEEGRGPLDEVATELNALEKEAADRLGVTDLEREGSRLGEQRQSLLDELADLDEKVARLTKERVELEAPTGAYHAAALDDLEGFLKGETIRDLLARARQTPDERDEGLIARIEGLDDEVSRLRAQMDETRDKLGDVSEKARGLRAIEREFRNNDYESSRSRFRSDFDIGQLLTGFLAGTLTAAAVNRDVRSSQYFKPVRTYSSSSSWSSSSSSSWGSSSFSSSGGFGGGGFSSSGGYSSGGGFSSSSSSFSTGGGFSSSSSSSSGFSTGGGF